MGRDSALNPTDRAGEETRTMQVATRRCAVLIGILLAGMASSPAVLSAAVGRPDQQIQAELPTTPLVDLRVAALPVAAWAPQYIAAERGYFRDVGLNVELVPFSNAS